LNASNQGSQSPDDPNRITCTNGNVNASKKYNQSSLCACKAGYDGLNCALTVSFNNAIFAALAGGIIALIVILAVLAALGILGGGALAVSQSVGLATEMPVINNPLFQAKAVGSENSLFGGGDHQGGGSHDD
jgi:hypothetical protein